MNGGEFPGLRDAASRSWVLAASGAAINRMAAARGPSVTWQWVKAGHVAFETLPGRERFRLCALMFGWAATIYWGALKIIPPYTATGLPHATFLALGIVAFVAAWNAGAMVRAWQTSRIANAVRWLVS